MNETSVSKFIDENGLIEPVKVKSGNGVCYTAEVAVQLNKSGHLSLGLKRKFLSGLASCMPEGGWLIKHPKNFKGDQDRIDNYTGALVLSVLCDCDLPAKAIYKWGSEHKKWGFLKYYYPNEIMTKKGISMEMALKEPFDFNAWLGVYPAWVACLKKSAGLKVSWLSELAISLAGSYFINWKSHDSIRIAHLTLQFSKHEWAKKRFEKKFKQHYKSWFELYTDYFQTKDHVFN